MASPKKTRLFRGQGGSHGIAIGTAHLIKSESLNVPHYWLPDRDVANEVSRFQQALRRTQQEISRIKEKLCHFQSGEQIKIIESHQLVVNDEMLVQETIQTIRHEKINAEWAFEKIMKRWRATLASTHDD